MIRITSFSFHPFRIPLCRPFGFGIVQLHELEHLLVRARVWVDGQEVEGIAGENLAPRWFEKNPAQSLEDDVVKLDAAVRKVALLALSLPPARTVFGLWEALYANGRQAMPDTPALVRQLGVSLVERCAIDAFCRLAARPFHELLAAGALGVAPRCLPAAPLQTIDIRHTVGLADAIEDLPADLGGIRRLKIKLGGDPEADARRLAAIDRSIGSRVERITLDGNENYSSVDALGAFLVRLKDDPSLANVRAKLAWIEQPLHRGKALADEVAPLLAEFGRFPHVIDESDEDTTSLPRALALGYAGTTHKNCKGVFKSILATAVLAEHARRSGRATLLSGEDLTIIAPWSQAQDLAVAAAVGAIDVERNGQHYAAGLSAFDETIQAASLRLFGDLYERTPSGQTQLAPASGRLSLSSANKLGFGGWT